MSAPGITVARLCSACGQVRPCPPGAVGAPWRCAACVAPALTDSPTGAPPDWVHPSMVAADDPAADARAGVDALLRERDDARADANALSADLTYAGEARDAWRAYAEHVEDCFECVQTSWKDCYVGCPLRETATQADKLIDPGHGAESSRLREARAATVAALTAERDALARLAEDRRGRLLLCAELLARSPWPEMLEQARAIRAEHGRGR